jgi:hypothetical protein
MAVKRSYDRDCVGAFCRGDPLLSALAMARQAQRLLFVVEAGLSTRGRSVIFRKRKFQLLPSHVAVVAFPVSGLGLN